jgi:NADH:ubiquinone oxidoreductase subunit 5 (subunit L)/multisubunit Na+/H+ antiporter MnhA subunit
MPVLGWGFALAFLGAASLPPTGGFMAKELIFEGLVHHHNGVVLALLVVAAVLNIAVFSKVLGVLWERRPGVAAQRMPGSEVLPAFLLGLAAALTGLIFSVATPTFEATLGPAEHGMLTAMWTHVGPLTGLSLLIYILGFGVYLTARERATSAADTFGGLVESPVTGPGLRMAAEGKLDLYEIGLKVVDFVTRVVFRYLERLIDVVVDGIIAGGKAVSGPALSAIHNGVYSNYLAWTVVGLIAVLALVLM